MVMIDDATNQTYALFALQETTRAAYDVFEGYVRRYGLPHGLYVDRDSIYQTTREPTVAEQLADKQPLTQFGRAMEQLGVELDCAFSPQAKGRVERRNGVFQDRLVKEMRLAGISDLAAANRFLEEKFLPELNRRFCVPAAQPADVHRALPRRLAEVLSWEELRVVQRDWTVSWQGRYFQISPRHEELCLVGKQVVIRELRDGTIQLVWTAQKLQFQELTQRPKPVKVVEPSAPKRVMRIKPSCEHPWRRFDSGIGQGQEFWGKVKAAGQAEQQQASRALRSASATLRPPSGPGRLRKNTRSLNHQRKGTFSPELTKGHF
jgi:hypothetical protein